MALFDLYLDLPEDYIKTIQDIYKYLVILVVFQVLYHYSYPSKNILISALQGAPLNDEFMSLVLFVMIGVAAYYLVAEKFLQIH